MGKRSGIIDPEEDLAKLDPGGIQTLLRAVSPPFSFLPRLAAPPRELVRPSTHAHHGPRARWPR